MTEALLARMTAARASLTGANPLPEDLPIKVGVDLGTAFTVIMVTDDQDRPLAGISQFADVVRDGIVWDFAGAQKIVSELKQTLEQRLQRSLTHGAVTIPPDVSGSDHRAHKYVLEGAGIECAAVVDEPTAANAVLGIRDGAVVDIGGGTTGIAILKDGEVITTVDEPSGGTHMSLVIAGALGVPFEEAEQLKRNPENHRRLYGTVLPVMQKISEIVGRAVAGHEVNQIHLVGGTSAFLGIDAVMSQVTGLPCTVAPEPMLVTPLGVAHWAPVITEDPLLGLIPNGRQGR